MVAAVIAFFLTLAVIAAVALGVAAVVRRRRRRTASVAAMPATRPAGAPTAAGQPKAPAPAGSPVDSLRSRFTAVGVLAALVFGTLTAKLWSMQILAYQGYRKQADENRYSIVYTPAPRGYIRDADGLPLVQNRAALTVLADPDVVNDYNVISRLSAVLGIPVGVVRNRLQDTSGGAQSQRVVASDVRMRDVAFISEHSDAFPGVTVQTRTVREYPYGALAAHVVGYTGSVTSEDLATAVEGRDIEMGDEIGRAGVESAYDNLLAGDHGERRVVADANGNVVEVESETQPVKGSDVYLTLKGPVQYAADHALAQLIAPGGVVGTGTGTGGAAIVMDVQDGGIVAMSSYPTFSPSVFIGGITQDTWDIYQAKEAYTPMLNRAIGGTYPAASTYKAFTSLAALAYGFATPTSTWTCTGSWDGWGTGSPQLCWLHSGHGTLDLRGGIVNSCDTVFYQIGYDFYMNSPLNGKDKVSETAMQDYISKYGFGELRGIDITGEAAGVVPTPAWKKKHFADYPEQATWQGGDSTNMAIGQGYVLATPLQLACAYGAIATGKIMRPHVFKDVRNDAGDVVGSYEPEVMGKPDVPAANLALVRDALNGVTTENASIAKQFSDRGIDPSTVACKTGTGEVANQEDYAWFVCYAPYTDPKYVVACVVEQGGGGSATGAPLGAELLAAALNYDAGTLKDMGEVAGSTGTSVPYSGHSSGRTD